MSNKTTLLITELNSRSHAILQQTKAPTLPNTRDAQKYKDARDQARDLASQRIA